MTGTAIVSPEVLIVMLVIVLVGTGIMTSVVKGKYGYTPEKEKELEQMDNPQMDHPLGQKEVEESKLSESNIP